MSVQSDRDEATRDLAAVCGARRIGDDRFEVEAPDWFGDRVFGGVVVAQALSAAMHTVDHRPPHSMHGYFLRPERPGSPIELVVERVRDGRTFSTRRVTMSQEGKELFQATASFHGGDPGDEYQMAMPADTPPPEDVATEDNWGPPPFEVREIGPTPVLPDGTYRSSRRAWVRSGALPDDPHVHLCFGAFLSDMTGTSFRPLRLDEWGHSTDASIDHAVWFHRPFRVDEWLLMDFQALINTAGRATVRGAFYTRDGGLCLSMAQELLIRPLDAGAGTL